MARFTRASKKQARLRAALFGPSGAGKTMSSLRIAAGVGAPIAVIDTERGSASKYADRFEFDVLDLEDRTIDGYIEAIGEAGQGGYNVLIIDSLSHAWQELLESVDKLAKAKYRGNTWSAWSEGTPQQRKLVNALLSSPCHVIATMRSKTEWGTEDRAGKKNPVRVGLAPEQGKGIEYEFDLLLELSAEHVGTVIKDRTGKFQDKMMEKPDEKFGKALVKWLSQGEEAPPPAPPEEPQEAPAPNGKITTEQRQKLAEVARASGHDAAAIREWLWLAFGVQGSAELPAEEFPAVLSRLSDPAPLGAHPEAGEQLPGMAR